MIVINEEPFREDCDLFHIALCSSKVSLQHTLKKLGVRGVSKMNKVQLANELNVHFQLNTAAFLNLLPPSEQRVLSELLAKPASQCAVVPRLQGKTYMLQKLFLVLTYKTASEWHLYMPQQVRTLIGACVESSVAASPQLTLFESLLQQLQQVGWQLDALMKKHTAALESSSGCQTIRREATALQRQLHDIEHHFRHDFPEGGEINVRKYSFWEHIDTYNMLLTFMIAACEVQK